MIIYSNEIEWENYKKAKVVYARCVADSWPCDKFFSIRYRGGRQYHKAGSKYAKVENTIYSTRKEAEEALKYLLNQQKDNISLKLQKVEEALQSI